MLDFETSKYKSEVSKSNSNNILIENYFFLCPVSLQHLLWELCQVPLFGRSSKQTFLLCPTGTNDKTHGVFLVMLVTFIQGGILSEVAPLSNQLLYNVGKALGRLNATLMVRLLLLVHL